MNVAELTRGKQSIDRLASLRTGDEMAEELFDFGLLSRDDTVDVFRNERGERYPDREVHAFAHLVGRPAE